MGPNEPADSECQRASTAMAPVVGRRRRDHEVIGEFFDREQPVDLIHDRMVPRHPVIRMPIRCQTPSWRATDRVPATALGAWVRRVLVGHLDRDLADFPSSLQGDPPRGPTGLEPGLEPTDRLGPTAMGTRRGDPARASCHRSDRVPIHDAPQRPDQKKTLEHMSPHPNPQQPRAARPGRTRIAHSTLSRPHARATSW